MAEPLTVQKAPCGTRCQITRAFAFIRQVRNEVYRWPFRSHRCCLVRRNHKPRADCALRGQINDSLINIYRTVQYYMYLSRLVDSVCLFFILLDLSRQSPQKEYLFVLLVTLYIKRCAISVQRLRKPVVLISDGPNTRPGLYLSELVKV